MAIDVGEAQMLESISQSNRQRQEEAAKAIYDTLSPQMQHYVDLATEKGASSWPTPHITVAVERSSQWIMPWSGTWEASPPFVTIQGRRKQ